MPQTQKQGEKTAPGPPAEDVGSGENDTLGAYLTMTKPGHWGSGPSMVAVAKPFTSLST